MGTTGSGFVTKDFEIFDLLSRVPRHLNVKGCGVFVVGVLILRDGRLGCLGPPIATQSIVAHPPDPTCPRPKDP